MADDLAASCTSPASDRPQIQVENTWGRALPKVVPAGEFYMVIHNRGNQADKLVGGRSPSLWHD